MARLLLFAIVLAVLAVALMAVMLALRAGPGRSGQTDGAPLMTLQNVAYALLLLLMLGITTGWIGGL